MTVALLTLAAVALFAVACVIVGTLRAIRRAVRLPAR